MWRWLNNWLADPALPRRAARLAEPRVVAYFWDGAAPAGCQLRDVSMTGAYLYTSERWYSGTIIRLLLQENGTPAADCGCSGTRQSISIPARVVRHGPDGLGLEFLFGTPEEHRALSHLVAGCPKSCSAPRRGQALIEFILIFPLLFLLIVNVVNFGAFFFAWITVADAARSGAEYWILSSSAIGAPTPATAAQVTTLITTDVSSLPNRASLVVRVCKNNDGTQTCSGSGSQTAPLDPEPATYISASVDVTYTYQPLIAAWAFSGLAVAASLPPTKIHRQAVMRMLQ